MSDNYRTEQELIALTMMAAHAAWGDGPSPTWAEVERRQKLEQLLGKKWDPSNRKWVKS